MFRARIIQSKMSGDTTRLKLKSLTTIIFINTNFLEVQGILLDLLFLCHNYIAFSVSLCYFQERNLFFLVMM